MHFRHLIVTWAAWLLWVADARASSIEVTFESSLFGSIIKISGRIEPGDATRFSDVADKIRPENRDPVLVIFAESSGGELREAMLIGDKIYAMKMQTEVVHNGRCASSCALAWLAGATRYMGEGAQIGFHAAYELAAGKPQTSGIGNALIGAYLTRIGLPEMVVEFATSAPPEGVRWLEIEQARRLGVKVEPYTGPVGRPPAASP